MKIEHFRDRILPAILKVELCCGGKAEQVFSLHADFFSAWILNHQMLARPLSKSWVEWRFHWLGLKLGWQRMLDAPVFLPEDIPCLSQSRLTAADAQTIFRFIADSYSLGPDHAQLEIKPDSSMPEGTVGLYINREHVDENRDDQADDHENLKSDVLKPSHIYLAKSELDDPLSTVATLAHELSHEILIGRNLLEPSDGDIERTTDLLAVFLGYGIFLGNNTVEDRSSKTGSIEHFSISQKGYLPSHMIGHAMALIAWLRDENKPLWATRLRPDAAKPQSQSLRYFRKTSDSLVTPDDLTDSTLRDKRRQQPFKKMSPSQRLGILWDIAAGISNDPQPVTTATKLLSDNDATVRSEALSFSPR